MRSMCVCYWMFVRKWGGMGGLPWLRGRGPPPSQSPQPRLSHLPCYSHTRKVCSSAAVWHAERRDSSGARQEQAPTRTLLGMACSIWELRPGSRGCKEQSSSRDSWGARETRGLKKRARAVEEPTISVQPGSRCEGSREGGKGRCGIQGEGYTDLSRMLKSCCYLLRA